MLACVCHRSWSVDEEPAKEFEGQYRDSEPEDPYLEQGLPEGFDNGKSNLIL
jgi:hypothetical protein